MTSVAWSLGSTPPSSPACDELGVATLDGSVVSSVKPPDSLQAGEGPPPFLQIKRIIKQYDDVFAVDDVSLNIQKGEIFALLGSSGCGKSTLLRMLAGFEMPTSGQIVLEGRDIGRIAAEHGYELQIYRRWMVLLQWTYVFKVVRSGAQFSS